MTEDAKGIGKCANNHAGSYGYPTRPEEPYGYCQKCGLEMVWLCTECQTELPEDPDELAEARFCRNCGTGYFGDDPVVETESSGENEEGAGSKG